MQLRQTPSRKKKSVLFTTVTTNTYQGRLNAGFSKVCEIFNVCGIESLKYVREVYTLVCNCGDISTPRNVMLKSVKRPRGRALANESCHGFQTFSRQSEGLAKRDYLNSIWMILCYLCGKENQSALLPWRDWAGQVFVEV